MQTRYVNGSNPLSIITINSSMSERVQLDSKLLLMGHRVTGATDPNEALEFLSSPEISCDLILLDVNQVNPESQEKMLETLTRELQARDEWRPVICLSHRSAPEDITASIRAGADDYINKPLNEPMLRAKLEAVRRVTRVRHCLQEARVKLRAMAYSNELTHYQADAML